MAPYICVRRGHHSIAVRLRILGGGEGMVPWSKVRAEESGNKRSLLRSLLLNTDGRHHADHMADHMASLQVWTPSSTPPTPANGATEGCVYVFVELKCAIWASEITFKIDDSARGLTLPTSGGGWGREEVGTTIPPPPPSLAQQSKQPRLSPRQCRRHPPPPPHTESCGFEAASFVVAGSIYRSKEL